MEPYSGATLKRVAANIWGAGRVDEILGLLDAYPAGGSEDGRVRVQLAILKVSEGDAGKIPQLVSLACRDFRDLLSMAEYPAELVAPTWSMPPGEAGEIRKRDREQYVAWLRRVGAVS